MEPKVGFEPTWVSREFTKLVLSTAEALRRGFVVFSIADVCRLGSFLFYCFRTTLTVVGRFESLWFFRLSHTQPTLSFTNLWIFRCIGHVVFVLCVFFGSRTEGAWSGRPGSNRWPLPWQDDALPLSYLRIWRLAESQRNETRCRRSFDF